MINYDFAILGGGASGLSLALALAQSPMGNRSILIIEKEAKNRNDRTWCYWTRQDSPLDDICHMAYIALPVYRLKFLQPYRYQMIRDDTMRQELMVPTERNSGKLGNRPGM
jgi:lycopene beta-cyclase